MIDNRNQYNVIKQGLAQLYPGKIRQGMTQQLQGLALAFLLLELPSTVHFYIMYGSENTVLDFGV
jgi:hypothetical protein